MVAFGRALLHSRRVEWEDAYVDYDGLKDLIQPTTTKTTAITATTEPTATEPSADNDPTAVFDKKLRYEIEKISLFALHRQGEIAHAIGALRLPNESSLSLFRDRRQPEQGQGQGHEQEGLRPSPSISTTTTTTTTATTTTIDAYTQCAVELLHWQRFVCINAVGIRKILKKFQKYHPQHRFVMINDRDYHHNHQHHHHHYQVPRRGTNNITSSSSLADPHLQNLANSAAVAAMNSSLWQACQELDPREHSRSMFDSNKSYQRQYQNHQHQHDQSTTTTTTTTTDPLPVNNNNNNKNDDPDLAERQAWTRLYCAVSLIQGMRNYARSMNETFMAFLSNKSMIGGQPLLQSPDEASLQALRVFLHFEPDSLLSMDVDRLENLWRDDHYSSAYRFLQGSFRTPLGADDKVWGGVDTPSLTLNLISTLLYTINYYIVAPTANHYAILLGVDGAFGATLVGASSLTAIFAAFLYSWWYTRFSFRSALLFSALCPCIGNLLYALAISYGSMKMAMLGRLLVGFGSAEVVNRQLISACVSFDSITSASAYFVAAGASGMSIGPLMAALLDMYAGRDVAVDLHLPSIMSPAGGVIFNHVTSPGFVTATLWLVQGMALLYFFSEPTRIHSGTETDIESSRRDSERSLDEKVKATLESVGVPLSDNDEENAALLPMDDKMAQNESASTRILSELVTMRKLVFGNMALPVTLLIFGFIELADEVLISSCSMVARRYFGWHGSTAGFIIASLGALVLPAHFIVEKAAHRFEERSIIWYSLSFIGVCLFAILNYEGFVFDFIGYAVTAVQSEPNATNHADIVIGGEDLTHVLNKHLEVPYDWGAGRPVYLVFLSAIFLGTIILEGVDTSVMAKVTPPALNVAFLNCGLLATLVGTLGRVAGDSMITLSALVDKDIFTDFVNATFFPMIPLVFLGLYLVRRSYELLV